ncbi:hypothetical protein [Phenylobacterium ferrooxidans]|uniref:DUF1707 domain-containing protein n=1 Tax=Phenylobacterium ferrooxidans TaxID=2982689 RepID=A0ABW6CJV5_9CAUL
MTDDDFIALDRAAARAALQAMPADEASAKRVAYMRAHGVTADPLMHAPPGAQPAARSAMRSIGIALVVIGAVIAAISLALIATAADEPRLLPLIWLGLGSSMNGLGVVMWIAGTIEDRLIEIRDRLPAAR